ncbi:MAG: hypothetical protein A2W05_06525 [Candidatus Schekmanbacteria bacterium RBG_16_38_10]|uniref:NodB homology domain-containing protein n=1 Tax=Candidatus Schekmanbacteria bacterium RBG_16_38_10 TaxID=1817879 RepID=A0A1F7RTM6_9BACT|nr:MAG: hypothetical protein A2W05_06525 [Candidatus Schekmanbacteria bacterium RBG_16_38_10]
MYHRVAPKAPPFFESVIRPDIFERQIRFLKKHYNIASLEEIESAAFNDGGKDMVVITFDDGYRDNYIHAFPVLKRYDVPASVFLTTDYIDTNRLLWFDELAWILYRSWLVTDRNMLINDSATYEVALEFGLISGGRENTGRYTLCSLASLLKPLPQVQRDMFIKELAARYRVNIWPDDNSRVMLSWDEVRNMAVNGISFGSHTKTHPVLSAIPIADVREEIAGSKKIIEDKLQKAVTTFAYPFGKKDDYTEQVVTILNREGIKRACTTNRGTEKYPIESPLTLKRQGVATSPYLFF